MKTLLILRHAKSSWKNEELADHDRPLNKRGKDAAPRVGELIRQQKMVPELILSSTANRARHTAELAAEAMGYRGKIKLLNELYAAPPEAYIQALAALDDRFRQVMVVGHNPGLEDLLQGLTHTVGSMPTASLACVELPIEHWSEIRVETPGRLLGIWRPKGIE